MRMANTSSECVHCRVAVVRCGLSTAAAAADAVAGGIVCCERTANVTERIRMVGSAENPNDSGAAVVKAKGAVEAAEADADAEEEEADGTAVVFASKYTCSSGKCL
jgi:hypothetical protein